MIHVVFTVCGTGQRALNSPIAISSNIFSGGKLADASSALELFPFGLLFIKRERELSAHRVFVMLCHTKIIV